MSNPYFQKQDPTRNRDGGNAQDGRSGPSRVLIGLSGGIHSSVTAALLKTQGHEVVGVHIDAGVPASLSKLRNHCVAGNSKDRAEAVAKRLGIEFQVVDASDVYGSEVVDYLVHERLLGGCPNPCVSCNKSVRIATLFKKADALRCEKVSTGHAAQLLFDPRSGTTQLLQGADPRRDQSYFLFTLSQDQLGRLLLPLGNFPRAMVARLGAEHGWDVEDVDAQSACFEQPLSELIESRTPLALRAKGVVISSENEVVGEHEGLYRYRIGEVPTIQLATEDAKKDRVVIGVDSTSRTLAVGPKEYLLRRETLLFRVSWLRPMNGMKGITCTARVTPSGQLFPCRLTLFENATVFVEFDEPCGPIVPGQAVVLYRDNEVLGGGWTEK